MLPNAAYPAELPLEWRISEQPVLYEEALSFMEERVAAIHAHQAPNLIWLLEHPPLYTAGTSAKAGDLLEAQRFPVYQAGRGGEYTYHGPGQRVAYVMLDLKALFAPSPPDLHAYIERLERWIIAALNEFGVEGFTRKGRVGVWVEESASCLVPSASFENEISKHESKIAAIGVRVRHWVSFHGIAINVHPDLSHFQGIVPCGIREHGVTSLHALGINASMAALDAALQRHHRVLYG